MNAGFVMLAIAGLGLCSCALQALEEPMVLRGQITAVEMPGPSALSRAQAKAWIGQSVEYSTTRAGFEQTACGEPRYETRSLSASAFQREFQIQPAQLGLTSGQVEVIEIGCPGPWAAPGSVLIRSDDRVFLLWDGVYFQIEP